MTSKVNWPTLKSLADSKNLTVQWTETSKVYSLYVADGPLIFTCDLDKDSTSLEEVEDFELNYKNKGNRPAIVKLSPFYEKSLSNGKKLYTRINGTTHELTSETTNIDFVVPYDFCKISGIEVLGGSLGDNVTLKILDTDIGTLSGISNFTLNEFGKSVNITPGHYKYESNYDADLIKDLKIRIEYSTSSANLPKTIYFNFILHEVKD